MPSAVHARRAGLLLHPSSLPGGHGIGDLGEAAFALLHWMQRADVTLWQFLPLGPTDHDGSPYTSRSALAGNLLLVDLRALVREGLLSPDELEGAPANGRRVDHAAVRAWKLPRVLRAASRLAEAADHPEYAALQAFATRERGWLDDVALFEAIAQAEGGAPWTAWPTALRDRRPAALKKVRASAAYRAQVAAQYLFERQWKALRAAASAAGVLLVGDAPIYVAHDSADVWAHRGLFELGPDLEPLAVAGVPPDAFSEEGQLWGNPLYDWAAHAAEDFAWWRRRMARLTTLCDIVRVDHFRGLQAYWRVPADAEDARGGAWCPGPGGALLQALRDAGADAILAEDLGTIDDDVLELRDRFGLPGMAVLQFAWDGDPGNAYLPHNHREAMAVYTGTHDNDTTLGWWVGASELVRHRVRVYFGIDGHDLVWDLCRAALASVARWAVLPVQDVIVLGSDARMNAPGLAKGNWAFRLLPGELGPQHAERLSALARTYGRRVATVDADDAGHVDDADVERRA